jgi:hypothetical protein
MSVKDLVDLVQVKFIELNNFCMISVFRGEYSACFLLIIDINDYPGFMIPVEAAEVGISKKMRSGPEQGLDGTGTRNRIRVVRHFNKKFRHVVSFPFI